MKHGQLTTILLVSLSIITTFNSCNKEDYSNPAPLNEVHNKGNDNFETFETTANYPKGQMVLGEKKENPYELKIMQQAFENIQLENGKVSGEKLQETHLYIKFIPDNDFELNQLRADTSLILYPYPLDYEIKSKGYSSRDIDVPANKPGFQYCAINAKKELPKKIKYLVLAKLFIPEDGGEQFVKIANGRLSVTELSSSLEYEAFKLTNNLAELKAHAKNAKVASYTPSGRIVFNDDIKGTIGVQGLQVRARRWFTTHRGYCDTNGYFTCDGTFSNDCDWSLNWENALFNIVDPSGTSLNLNRGANTSNSWNITIADPMGLYFSELFRPAFRYYFLDVQGLRRPLIGNPLEIRAMFETNSAADARFFPLTIFGTISQVKVWLPNSNSDYRYGTIIHELAHAAHWNINPIVFIEAQNSLRESWAAGVEHIVTQLEYTNYSNSYGISPPYTDVVKRMIDPINPPNDNVSGYNIKQIEDAIVGTRFNVEWMARIINNYENSTENNVPALFNFHNLL